mgnify:CR=1 FL=1
MNANYLKLEKGKQIGIRKRILKGNKYYWYSYDVQKVNDIYISSMSMKLQKIIFVWKLMSMKIFINNYK